eukprot:1143719-Pelagomonas_calceolata.AAC.6
MTRCMVLLPLEPVTPLWMETTMCHRNSKGFQAVMKPSCLPQSNGTGWGQPLSWHFDRRDYCNRKGKSTLLAGPTDKKELLKKRGNNDRKGYSSQKRPCSLRKGTSGAVIKLHPQKLLSDKSVKVVGTLVPKGRQVPYGHPNGPGVDFG